MSLTLHEVIVALEHAKKSVNWLANVHLRHQSCLILRVHPDKGTLEPTIFTFELLVEDSAFESRLQWLRALGKEASLDVFGRLEHILLLRLVDFHLQIFGAIRNVLTE